MIALVILCLAAASVNIFTLRPDADDFSYLHRALHAADHLADPIILEHTSHELTNLPPISPVHLLTSFEVSEALFAKLFGLPIIFFAHQVVGALVLLLTPLSYFQLFRALGFVSTQALLGTLGALVFLVISGDFHQDWGNFTVVRAWQGKCILVLLVLPFIANVVIRFMYRGKKEDLVRMFGLMLLGIGLSSSAFFLLPYSFGLLSVAICLAQGMNRSLIRRFFGICSVLVIPGILVTAALSPFFHQLTNADVWVGTEPRTPVQWLSLVIPTWTDVLIYSVVWSFCLVIADRQTPQKAFLFYSLAATLILLLPGVSDLLMYLTKPGVYWRLAYASLMPAVVGFSAAATLGSLSHSRTKVAFCAACFLFMATTKNYAVTANVLSLPHKEKFAPEQVRATDEIAPKLRRGAIVAAPESILIVLGLHRPDLRFLTTRSLETLHVFRNFPEQAEADRRISLADFLNNPAKANAAVLESYLSKLDAILLPAERNPQSLEALLDKSTDRWTRHTTPHGWNLWRKQPLALS